MVWVMVWTTVWATAVSLIMGTIHIVMEDFMVTIMVAMEWVMVAMEWVMVVMEWVMEWVMVVTTVVDYMDLGATTGAFTILVVTDCVITQLLIEEMNDQAICHQNGIQTSEVLQDLPGETHTYQGRLQELAADLVLRLWLPIREGLLQLELIRNRLSVAAE